MLSRLLKQIEKCIKQLLSRLSRQIENALSSYPQNHLELILCIDAIPLVSLRHNGKRCQQSQAYTHVSGSALLFAGDIYNFAHSVPK